MRRKERKCRVLEIQRIFKPVDIPLKDLEVIDINMDEFEAVRLCDFDNKNQTEAGEHMKISRGTVQRLLASGRKKIIDALLHEKALNIQIDNSYFEDLTTIIKRKLKILFEKERIIKIAIPTSDKKNIEEHFGKTKYFYIFTLENGEIKDMKYFDSPDHQPGVFPKFLNEKNINIVVAYGMGSRAIEFFKEYKIETVLGAKGDIDNIIKLFKEEK